MSCKLRDLTFNPLSFDKHKNYKLNAFESTHIISDGYKILLHGGDGALSKSLRWHGRNGSYKCGDGEDGAEGNHDDDERLIKR